MKNAAQIKVFILLALRRTHGEPLPERTLISAVKISHANISDDEVRSLISDLEVEQFISGNTDDLTEMKQWVLTQKGTARANQLS